MAEFASNGKGNLGVTLGAIGTGLAILNGGTSLLSNTTNNTCTEDKPITRYEFEMGQQLAAKDSEIALLKSEQNTENKITEVYRLLKADLNAAEKEQQVINASQQVVNQATSDGLSVLNTQVSTINNVLSNITQVKVPNSAVCPGWGAVSVTPATTGCGCNSSTSLY